MSLAHCKCNLVSRPDKALEAVELSPHYSHRLFKARIGLTPKEYASAHQASRVRKNLQTGPSITQAIYDAGNNSNGRFYEAAQAPATARTTLGAG